MIRSVAIIVCTVLATMTNPASFTCDTHNQTFVRSGTISRDGRCYDVYKHSSPNHQVLVACQ